MSELREVLDLLKRGIRAEKSMEIDTDNYIEDAIYDIEQWHIRERKKWAISRKPKEKKLLEINLLSDDVIFQTNHETEIYNQALTDWGENLGDIMDIVRNAEQI